MGLCPTVDFVSLARRMPCGLKGRNMPARGEASNAGRRPGNQAQRRRTALKGRNCCELAACFAPSGLGGAMISALRTLAGQRLDRSIEAIEQIGVFAIAERPQDVAAAPASGQ